MRSLFPVIPLCSYNPIERMAKKVAKSAGLPGELAAIPCLAAVSAVTGHSRHLIGPAYPLYGGFHVFGVSSGRAQAEALLFGLPFQSLLIQASVDVLLRNPKLSEAGFGESACLTEIAEREGEAEKIKAGLVGKRPATSRGSEQVTDKAVRDGQRPRPGSPQEQSLRLDETLGKLGKARDALVIVRRRDKPLVVTRGWSVDELFQAREWASQGALCNVDPFGDTFGSAGKLGRKAGGRFLGLLASSFDGRPWIDSGKAPCMPMVTHAGRIGREHFADLLAGGASPLGTLRRSVVLDLGTASAGTVDLQTAFRPVPEFTGLLAGLCWERFSYQAKRHQLSADAVLELQRLVLELERRASDAPGVASFVERWPDLAMKMALLLHLGRAPEEPWIDGETMRRAIGLLVAVGSGGVTLMADWSRETPRVSPGSAVNGVDILVDKVRRRGPLTRRDLCRTYHDQRVGVIAPVLESALDRGLVVERDGLLVAP